jgi:hypothetical protein
MYIISYKNIIEQSNKYLQWITKFKQGQVKAELDAGKIPISNKVFIISYMYLACLGRRINNIFVIHWQTV